MSKKIKPPIVYRGARVYAQPHKGGGRDGRVTAVETHYGLRSNEPYHVYAVRFDGNERSQWIGEESIFTVYAEESPQP